MSFNYVYGNSAFAENSLEPLRFCLDVFRLEHGWDISAVAPSTQSLDCHGHLDALCRVMFSEMVTETAACFGVKPDLGQGVPKLTLRPDATSSPGVSWKMLPMVLQNPHTHGWELSFSPPALRRGQHHTRGQTQPLAGQRCGSDPVVLWCPFPRLQLCCYIAGKLETDFPSFGFQTGTSVFWDFPDIP